MGARLQYAKVIDREMFLARGGRIQPGLPNEVVVDDEPGKSAAFLVLRGWRDGHGTFTERWRIESPGGGLVYASLPRELHLATASHVERLEDEIADLDIQYSGDNYTLVFELDDREAARVDFTVKVSKRADRS